MEKSGNIHVVESEYNFKRINKSIIRELDATTVGVYAKILLFGNEWQLNIKGLSTVLGMTEKKTRSYITILEAEGYIVRKAIYDKEKHRLSGWDYYVYSEPVPKEERTSAGHKKDMQTENADLNVSRQDCVADLPIFRQDCKPDMSENGEDIIYKPKGIDKPNRIKKEERDKSLSKKETAQSLVEFWNKETRDFPKVRKLSPDIIASIEKLLKRGYTYEDMKKAIYLCNSLSDFYKGKEKGKTWKATFQWLIHNTNNNFDMIINGSLHTSQDQMAIYTSIMDDGIEAQLGKYMPYCEYPYLVKREADGLYYFTGNIMNLADGYTEENRPNGAQVHQNGYTYTWNSSAKEWEMR